MSLSLTMMATMAKMKCGLRKCPEALRSACGVPNSVMNSLYHTPLPHIVFLLIKSISLFSVMTHCYSYHSSAYYLI